MGTPLEKGCFKYLDVKTIVTINANVILQHTPKEPVSVLDAGASDMIVEQPKGESIGQAFYLNIYDKAEKLFINTLKKHAFANENKRTAWTAMVVFFAINGYTTNFPKEEGIEFTLKVTQTDMKKVSFNDLKHYVSNYLRESQYIRKK